MGATVWLLVLGALLVLAFYGGLVYLAWWALFHDRARGRRRCPRCWHDLSHTPGETCSECGFVASDPRQFGRTRRRWAIAGLAMIACALLTTYVYWVVLDRTWTSYAPTRLLIASLPLAGGRPSAVHTALMARIATGRVSDEDWMPLLERCAKGDWLNRPTSDTWVQKYGTIINARRAARAAETDEQWDARSLEALLSIPARVELTTRSAWPRGTPPHVRLVMREWWPPGAACRVRLRCERAGGEERIVYRSAAILPRTGYWFTDDAYDPRQPTTTWTVQIERQSPSDETGDGVAWTTMSRHTLTLTTRWDDPGNIALEAVDSEALSRAMWRALSGRIVQWPGGPSPVRFYFRSQATHTSLFEDTAVGVHVDLLHGETVARRLDLWWLGGTGPADRHDGWAAPVEDLDLLTGDVGGEGWSMRVTGDPAVARQAGDAGRYWAGQFTIPVRVDHDSEEAPPRAWTTEPVDGPVDEGLEDPAGSGGPGEG